MSSDKSKQLSVLEAELDKVGASIRAKEYIESGSKLNQLAQKLVNVLCGSAVEAQEAWNELKPTAKLSARHYRLPIELLAYKILASCFTQDLVSNIAIFLNQYLEWRSHAHENATSSYTKLTRFDLNVFQAAWNYLADLRQSLCDESDTIMSSTIKALSILRSSADFEAKPEPYFKNAMRIAASLRNDETSIFEHFHSLRLTEASDASVVSKSGTLSNAFSYFRCLSAYTHAAAKTGNVNEAEKAANLHNSTLQALVKCHLPGTLVELEKTFLCLSLAEFRWIAWSSKPNEATLKIFSAELAKALAQLNGLIKHLSSENSSLIDGSTEIKEEFHALVKVCGLMRDFVDLFPKLLSSKSGTPSLTQPLTTSIRSLYEYYSTLFAIGSKEESKVPVQLSASFKQTQTLVLALGSSALLSVELEEIEEADRYFVRAEATIRKANAWNMLKPLFQQLHKAAGTLSKLPARAETCVQWMQQSCKLHQEFIDKFPQEKSEELTTKLSMLASLEARLQPGEYSPKPSQPSRARPTTTHTTHNTHTTQESMESDTMRSMTQRLSASPKATLMRPDFVPNELFPLIDAHVKARLKQLSPNGTSPIPSFCSLFIDQNDILIVANRQTVFAQLIDFESTLYLYFKANVLQISLINSALSSGKFSDPQAQVKLLVARAMGLRKSQANEASSTLAQDLLTSLKLLISILFEKESLEKALQDTSPHTSRLIGELAFVQTLRAVSHFERISPSSNSSESTCTILESHETVESVLDNGMEMYNLVLSRMMSVSGSKSLLDQNRSHWTSIDSKLETLSNLRDLLSLHGDHQRYIATLKILLKSFATLQPHEISHCNRARMGFYAQIAHAFHELGYDDPLATKYFTKSGSGSEGSLIETLQASSDPSLSADNGEWLSSSINFLHDVGRIPEFDYVGHLESISQSLEEESFNSANRTRSAFVQNVRSSILFTLAHIKSTSGLLDEAIVDALLAFQIRATGGSKGNNAQQAPSSSSKQLSAPPYWRPSPWRFTKQILESMDQLSTLYQLQGSVAESRHYMESGLQCSQKYKIKSYITHFRLRIAQIDLESGANTTDAADADLEDSSQGTTMDRISHSLAFLQRGNSFIRQKQLENAEEELSKAEEVLLSLIETSYVQTLERQEEAQETSSSRAKSSASSRSKAPKKTTAKSTSSLQVSSDGSLYRFSMSPAKLPKSRKNEDLPSDYIGLKRTHLRIQLKQGLVKYLMAIQELEQRDGSAESSNSRALELLDSSLVTFSSIKDQLESIESCESVAVDLATVMLHQAKVMIAQQRIADSFDTEGVASTSAALTTAKASSTRAKSTTSKKTTAKVSKTDQKSINRVEQIRSTLTAAFSLSISGGSVSKVSSEICRYLAEFADAQDPWTAVARQNSAIGITNRHQALVNIYRLGLRGNSTSYDVSSKDDEQEVCDEEVESLSRAIKNGVTINEAEAEDDAAQETLDESEERLLRLIAEENEFKDDKMDGEAFKCRFVDSLGDLEETRNLTICTLSLGSDDSSLIVSRLRYGEEPLFCKIDVSRSLDEATEKAFAQARNSDEELVDDDADSKTPALMRSSTALLGPLLSAPNDTSPSLKRSASTGLSRPQGSTSLANMALQAQQRQSPKVTSSVMEVDSESTQSVKPATKAKRSSATSTSSSRAKATRARTPITSVEDIGTSLDDMLSNLSLSSSSSHTVDQEVEAEIFSTFPTSSSTSIPKSNIFQRFQQEFKSIIQESDSIAITTTSTVDLKADSFRRQWWAKRHALDARLSSWLSNFEDSILAPYKALLVGKLEDRKLEEALSDEIPSIVAKLEQMLKLPAGSIYIPLIKALLAAMDGINTRDIIEALRALAGWMNKQQVPNTESALQKAALYLQDAYAEVCTMASEQNIVEQSHMTSGIFKAFLQANEEICSNTNETNEEFTAPRQLRHPVILILDKHLHHLPWESLPILRPNPTNRLPSIFALRSSIQSKLQPDSPPNVLRDGIDPQKLFYMLNPSKDLKTTQETLQPLLVAKENWKGLVAESPSTSHFVSALETQNLLLYCGHESGMQYLKSAEVRKARARAGGCVVWLMGCSSAKLRDHAEYDPSGMVLTYLVSGSPSVVGNLWNVTSRDLDQATISMLNWLEEEQDGEEGISSNTLAGAVHRARQACKLKFINGAALVTYGLPVKVKRTPMVTKTANRSATATPALSRGKTALPSTKRVAKR